MNHTFSNHSLLLKYVAVLLIILCGGCASNQMERNFFDSEYDQAGTRFNDYTIPDQIKIYLYGVQAVNPPVTVLSRPVAEHGQAAIPYIMNTLSTNPSDQNVRDFIVVFEAMQRLGTYDVANDKQLLQTLDTYVAGMKNNIWRGYTKATLAQIKKANRDEDAQN